jgi:hypothetical protein
MTKGQIGFHQKFTSRLSQMVNFTPENAHKRPESSSHKAQLFRSLIMIKP